MSFHLIELAIYNASGERRTLKFTDGLNIITGSSKTGKSALIGILDYYLIPAGKIRENVVWYVIRIGNENSQAVIGRPAAKQGAKSNSEAYLIQGGELTLPDFNELERNSNTEALTKFLTEFLGIGPNVNIPKAGQSRDELSATISHATFLLFQPQDRIADPKSLFYRQEEPFIPQSIKDTLPYFLGAATDDRFSQLNKLRQEKRKLKLLIRRFEEVNEIVGSDNSKARTLYSEAQQYGLASSATVPDDLDGLIEGLRQCVEWKPESPSFDSNERLRDLREAREELIFRLENLQSELSAAKSLALDQTGFSKEVAEQKNRLQSIGLYEQQPGNNSHCPLCNNALSSSLPTADNLNESLRRINAQIEAVVRQQPRLEKYIGEKEALISQTLAEMESNKSSLESIYAQQQALNEVRSRVASQARIVGRISLYLESVRETADTEELQNKIAAQQKLVNRLEKLTSDESLEEHLDVMLRIISDRMSQWAKRLDLEHSEYPFSLDIKNLTVQTYTGTEPITMAEMGSGANWLGCHLIAILALHQWFVSHNRPVPRIVFFDQPTQAYFPTEVPIADQDMENLEDADKELVRLMFKFIYDITVELSPKLQVIITDHADLTDDWFQNAIVEKWRGGKKLVPVEWYD